MLVPQSIEGIVFSKDRPLQLHALLRSVDRHVLDQIALTVIYVASNPAYQAAYEELMELHFGMNVTFVPEDQRGFRPTLHQVLEAVDSSCLLFLVDDMVFIRDVRLRWMAGFARLGAVPSIRLSPLISWSYTRDCAQTQPRLWPVRIPASEQPGFLQPVWCWTWENSGVDWSYPLSLDGNVFVASEISQLIRDCRFAGGPNALEGALQTLNSHFSRRWGVCFSNSIAVNLALNRVQDFAPNRHGGVHQDGLLRLWNSGLEFDLTKLDNLTTTSVHLEIEPTVMHRSTP